MERTKKSILFWGAFLFVCTCWAQKIDLRGKWSVTLESNFQKGLIDLPSTTDDAKLGTPSSLSPLLEKPQLTYLTRTYSYEGVAEYAKEVVIPNPWKNKRIYLKLERVLWKSELLVDGKKIAQSCNSLATPHVYDLTGVLSPGKHTIALAVDNGKQYQDMSDMTHAYTNHTQIRWNGVLGEISLTACDPVELKRTEITPQIDAKSIALVSYIHNYTAENITAEVTYKVKHSLKKEVELRPGINRIETVYTIGEKARLWSELSPYLYTLQTKVKAGEYSCKASERFGLREFVADGNQFKNNHIPVSLRGTLECCVFPLTGYPPMTKEGWRKVFLVAKEWGLNHLRFHSWCPPKSAFEVADELGFYLQVELPIWSLSIGNDQKMTDFLYEEGRRISREYGNHPSFCMFSLGNELQGDMDVLARMVTTLKKEDPRRLYTTTSFTFEGGHGSQPEVEDDFFVTQWTKKGWVRGQGVFNSEPPSFDKDYSQAIESINIPLITHEIGQYAVYPDMKEIEKYTGVLKPLNFIAIKKDLEKKGLLPLAETFLQSSGKLAALLYKEEIERALKTEGISGFQLLDLHDFPGQGTALVGLLNAFWENKGAISARDFRGFSAPVVPLLRFPRAIYRNNESFVAKVEISNYSLTKLSNQHLVWKITNESGTTLRQGKMKLHEVSLGYNRNLGDIQVPLSAVKTAQKLTVSVAIAGSDYRNQWNVWVYPAALDVNYDKVHYTRNYEEAKQWLADGKTVLYNPDWRYLEGIEGKFVPVFWSPVHFPAQAGTMGMWCNPHHKAFTDFPTDMNSDWQWWDLQTYSTTLVTDSIQGGNSIVSMIDNFTNNRKLSLLYEGRVGNGHVVVCAMDLQTQLEQRPVAKQMLYSVVRYMNSPCFQPPAIENFELFGAMVRDTPHQIKQSAKSLY